MKVPSKKVLAEIIVHEFHKVDEVVDFLECGAEIYRKTDPAQSCNKCKLHRLT